MLKRPSSRRRSSTAIVQINLIPMLDALVTLIGFLLFTLSYLALVHVETLMPQVSSEQLEQQLKEKPLQLTVSLREGDVQVWSPFEKFATKVIPNTSEGLPDVQAVHRAIVEVKQQFPKETKVVLAPYGGASYDVLVSLMDSVRVVEPTDPPLFIKNEKTGNDEPIKMLFPEVVFGNLLGDS